MNQISPYIFTLAQSLCPEPIITLSELNKGGNSRIYRVEGKERAYALKQYPIPNANDQRNRLHIEADALRFMEKHVIKCVPQLIAQDNARGFSLLSWCEGKSMEEITTSDIAQFSEFLIKLADISQYSDAQHLGYASEACISGEVILAHIHTRFTKLQQVEHSDLQHFLHEMLLPYLLHYTSLAKETYQQLGLSFEQEIPRALQVLIPSDYGSHNALRTTDGLNFLDFEYFGWDDPVTSTANFILHPAMQLTPVQSTDFMQRMEQYFVHRDTTYPVRLQALLPLFAARFCVIVLGEFIPAHWQHRVACGKYGEEEKETVLKAQLAKAYKLIEGSKQLA